jgi:hypothetical protein
MQFIMGKKGLKGLAGICCFAKHITCFNNAAGQDESAYKM